MANVNTDVKHKSINATLQVKQTVFANVQRKGPVSVELNGHAYVYDKDYEHLQNKPSIENVTLSGNKELQELGITEISNKEITNILNKVFED